jgi:hypothetical protein
MSDEMDSFDCGTESERIQRQPGDSRGRNVIREPRSRRRDN